MATILDTPLNEQQLMMLRLLKNPLPDTEFLKVRRFVVKILAGQLDEEMGRWEKENNITETDYIRLSQGHFRSKSK